MQRTLLILGHPREDSFCGALSRAYLDGAGQAGAEVRMIHVGALEFDPLLDRRKHPQEGAAGLEPCLLQAQEDMAWARHLVFVYPIWWGNVPAVLKGFIDRVFQLGFGFCYRQGSSCRLKLLGGRSARLIETMDAPVWWYALAYRAPARNAMRRALLECCGIRPVRHTSLGRVRWLDDAARGKCIERVRELGRREAVG